MEKQDKNKVMIEKLNAVKSKNNDPKIDKVLQEKISKIGKTFSK